LGIAAFAGLALVAAACGVRAAIPGPTELSPTVTTAATEQVMPALTKDIVLQSLQSWKAFHHGPTNISIVGEPLPFVDPADTAQQMLYLMKTTNGDGTMYCFSSVLIEAERDGKTKGYNMPAVTRLSPDGSKQTFGLFEISAPNSSFEQFLVRSLAPDGSLKTETWKLQITHLPNGKSVFSVVGADGREMPLEYARAKSSDQAQEGVFYDTVFRLRNVEAIPTSAVPEYKGVPLYTVDEAKQIILSEGSTNPKDRKLSEGLDSELFHTIFMRNPNGTTPPWVISYEGIVEAPESVTPHGDSIAWFNNRVLVNGKLVDSVTFDTTGIESGHSIVIFTNKSGNYQVMLLDAFFIFEDDNNRPVEP
jgi:hypothetical protein